MHQMIEEIERTHLKEQIDNFQIGDTVGVHFRIIEGEKERIQIFHGTVIARKGHGINAAFTVRRIVAGEGVERVFPLHSPRIEKIVVEGRGRATRAKLYYLRERTGKAASLKEENRPNRLRGFKRKSS